MKEQTANIFNYEFKWSPKKKKAAEKMYKDECCEKYMKKGEKKCKKCPKRAA
jgi:hypothetical protein